MELTLEQLRDYAEKNEGERYNIADPMKWLASQCLNSLLGNGIDRHFMATYFSFADCEHSVEEEYGEFTKKLHASRNIEETLDLEEYPKYTGKALAVGINKLIQERGAK